MTVTDTPTACPACAGPLLIRPGTLPWCPACEWNLEAYDAARIRPVFGWPVVDRWLHRLAVSSSRSGFAAMAGRPLGRPGVTPALLVLALVSVLMFAFTLACLGVGLWLIAFRFPNLTMIPGALLVLIAVFLRPSFGRVDPDAYTLERATAPTLFALVDRTAAAISAPVPHRVEVSTDFTASAGAYGLRRRRVLVLGLPLWVALRRQEWVALLGHELGHFTNGDLRRSVLTQPAYETLRRIADLLAPSGRARGLFQLVMQLFQWVSSRAVLLVQVLVWVVGEREAQRAEYRADAAAATVAGSQAAISLSDVLVAARAVEGAVRVGARNGEVEAPALRARADEARANVAGELTWRRQLTVREESSLLASHPPSGLRARMIESRPPEPPRVVVTESDAARIDAELATWYSRRRREIG